MRNASKERHLLLQRVCVCVCVCANVCTCVRTHFIDTYIVYLDTFAHCKYTMRSDLFFYFLFYFSCTHALWAAAIPAVTGRLSVSLSLSVSLPSARATISSSRTPAANVFFV
jgi:hypothetical protein